MAIRVVNQIVGRIGLVVHKTLRGLMSRQSPSPQHPRAAVPLPQRHLMGRYIQGLKAQLLLQPPLRTTATLVAARQLSFWILVNCTVWVLSQLVFLPDSLFCFDFVKGAIIK